MTTHAKATATAPAREVHHGYVPRIGETLLYRVTNEQADRINSLRIVSRSVDQARLDGKWPNGAQAHLGQASAEGEVLPLIVTRIVPDHFGPGRDGINGQLILDGSDSLWIEKAGEGEGPGQWRIATAGQ